MDSSMSVNSEERQSLLGLDDPVRPMQRKPVSPAPGTAMANRWRYYQYLNMNLQDVPRAVTPHFLSYNEDDDDDKHFGGGENILIPVVKQEDYGKSSLMSALFNLTTTIVGGGTLSLPYAMASAGVALGPIIMFVVAVFAAVSAHLLVKMSTMGSSPSYKDIAIDAYGVWGAKVVEVVIVVFTWGALAAYLVIMGDSIKPVLTLIVHGTSGEALCPDKGPCVWYFDERFHIAVWMCLTCIPLGLLKKMSFLKYTSIGSLSATTYIVIIVMVRSVQFLLAGGLTNPLTNPDIILFNWDVKLFISFPILAIAYCFHMNIGPVQMELSNPTQGRVQLACVAAVSAGSVLYLTMGVFGYLHFGGCVQSNILKSFVDPSDIVVQTGRIAFLLVMTCAFPLVLYPCRMNVRTLLFRTLKKDNVFHVVSTLCIIITAYAIAISGVNLGFIFGILGATCGNFLIYTFPGALYIKLSSDHYLTWRKMYAFFAVGFGLSMMVICLFATVYFNGDSLCVQNATNASSHNASHVFDFMLS